MDDPPMTEPMTDSADSDGVVRDSRRDRGAPSSAGAGDGVPMVFGFVDGVMKMSIFDEDNIKKLKKVCRNQC